MAPMTTTNTYEQQAYELGCEHARNAAAWVTDGNTTQEHIARLVAMLENGDPAADQFLPVEPNLGGEWADSPTPLSIAREISGDKDFDHDELIDAMADAYENGVTDTFHPECERILRAAL